MKKTRTKHSAAYKAKVALEAVQERNTVAEIARRHKLYRNVVYKCAGNGPSCEHPFRDGDH